MKDIKSLFEAAKNTQSQTDIAAYKEAVNELLESKPSDFLSNLKYIITSDIGFPSISSFAERYGISIAAYEPIMESLEYCIEQCNKKGIDSTPYKDFMKKMKLIRSKYQHCYDMYEYYKDDDMSSYLEAYYGRHKSGVQNSKCINIMIDNFNECAIADAIITGDRIDGKAICQILEYVSTKSPDKILSQWICECAKDVHMDYNNEDGSSNIRSSSKLLNLFEFGSLSAYVSSMKEAHNNYMRESLILGETESEEVGYTENDISIIRDLISFKEYQIACTENSEDAIKLQNEVYELYESYGELLEDTADDILPMLPQQKSITEDISWRNTRNKKTGSAPSYLSTNHNLGYGEEDNPDDINSYKRKSASKSDDSDDEDEVTTSDDNFDDDEEVGAKPTTPEEKSAINNYYYYTYNNSLNKHTDNSVNNSRRTDDHSTGKTTGSYNKDDHSHHNGNDRDKGAPYTEGFIDFLFKKKKGRNRAHDRLSDRPSKSHITIDKSKIIIVTDEIKNDIVNKVTEIKKSFNTVINPILQKYQNFGMHTSIETFYDNPKTPEDYENYNPDDNISKRIDEIIQSDTEWLNTCGENVSNAIYLDNNYLDIQINGCEWRDLIQDIVDGKYPGEYDKWKSKYDLDDKHDSFQLFWTEKLFGYDKSISEICDIMISNIVKSQFPIIKDWDYLSDGDDISYGGRIWIKDIYTPNTPKVESSDPTELDIFGNGNKDFFMERLYNNEYEVYVECCEAVTELLESGNEPRFKYAYKAAYDFDTGHALKITYSLNPITITNVGVAKPVRDEILSIVNKTADAVNNKNIFSAILTAVNGLIKSKSNIEMRKTVLTEILNKYIDQVGYVDFQAKDCRIISITDRATKEKLKGPINIVGVYAAADLNENRSLALSPYTLKRMQDRVQRRGSNFKISTISVGDIQTVPTFMSTYWDRNCDKGLVNQNGDVIVDDDMDRDNLSQIISSREIQGFDIDTKNSRFSDSLGDFVDPIRNIGDSKKNKLFKKLAYNDSVKFIGQCEDLSILANKALKLTSSIPNCTEDDLKPINDFISSIDNKLKQADDQLRLNNHEEVFNVLNIPETLDQQKEKLVSIVNGIYSKYGITSTFESFQFEAVGDADDDKPESDHPVRDILMDLDREKVKSQQKMKQTVQNVQNVARAAVKPAQRTKQWLTNMVNDWKDKDENAIKEKMADPAARRNIFSAINFAIKTGSLFKAGLLLNPVFLFLSITKKVSNNKNQQRIRNEMIGELKTELEVIDAKIEDAKYNNDNKAKYQLMRLRNEINKKLLRVSGSESNKKWIKKGEIL